MKILMKMFYGGVFVGILVGMLTMAIIIIVVFKICERFYPDED